MKRRFLSVLLALAVLLGVSGTGAEAYSTDPSSNCTYVCWKKANDMGFSVPDTWGNGSQWYLNARNAGYTVIGPDEVPPPNSIACWSGGDIYDGVACGHVAYVLSADGSGVKLYEGGTGGAPRTSYQTYSYIKYSKTGGSGNPLNLQGYISLAPLKAPSWAGIAVNKSKACIGETITFTCESDTGTGYCLGVNRNGRRILTQDIASGFTACFQEAGQYTAYVSAFNHLGLVDSPVISFEVYGAPSWAKLTTDKERIAIHENVSFYCEADVPVKFCIGINRGSKRILTEEIPASYQTSFDQPGEYTAYVSAYNDAGLIDSVKVNLVVYDPNLDGEEKPEYPGSTETPGTLDPTPYPGTPFTDIADHWGKDSIKWAYTKNLFSGTSADKFSPNNSMSRGMLATVLYRLKGSPSVSGDSGFWDVSASQYYAKPIKWAADNQIVSGMGGGSFAPDSSITREQLAVMLHNYERSFGSPSGQGDLSQFSDGGSVSPWAQSAVRWAVSEGILTGKGDGRLDPKGNATRAEVASMLYRFAA